MQATRHANSYIAGNPRMLSRVGDSECGRLPTAGGVTRAYRFAARVRCTYFTLVEIIVVVIIVGILAAVGVLGLTAAVDGYVTGRTTMRVTRKAQNALQRMIMELRFIKADDETGDLLLNITGAGSEIDYVSKRDDASHTLVFQGDRLILDGKALTDEVDAFQAEYDAETGELRLRVTMASVGLLETSVFP